MMSRMTHTYVYQTRSSPKFMVKHWIAESNSPVQNVFDQVKNHSRFLKPTNRGYRQAWPDIGNDFLPVP
jgi:hypothetical protein